MRFEAGLPNECWQTIGTEIPVGAGVRVRRDRIDNNGKVTLRHQTRLHHIGIGHAHKGKRVILLVDDLDVRVLSEDGELLRHLMLDRPGTTSHRDVGLGRCLRCPETSVHDVPTHHIGVGGPTRTIGTRAVLRGEFALTA